MMGLTTICPPDSSFPVPLPFSRTLPEEEPLMDTIMRLSEHILSMRKWIVVIMATIPPLEH